MVDNWMNPLYLAGDSQFKPKKMYPLSVTNTQQFEIPEDSEFLTVQMQRGQPCLWAIVDTEKPKIIRNVHIVGTGHEITFSVAECKYVGTFQPSDDLVFHVFADK